MKNCPKCGSKVEEDAKFCTNCGNKLSPKNTINFNAGRLGNIIFKISIVLALIVLVFNWQNICAFFISPTTPDLNSVNIMTKVVEKGNINASNMVGLLIFLLFVFWLCCRIKYKSGLKITIIFTILNITIFIIGMFINNNVVSNVVSAFSELWVFITFILMIVDLYIVSLRMNNIEKGITYIAMLLLPIAANGIISTKYEDGVWEKRNEEINIYASDIKKVFSKSFIAIDSNDNKIWVKCINPSLKRYDKNDDEPVSTIQRGVNPVMPIIYDKEIRQYDFSASDSDFILSNEAEEICQSNDLSENEYRGYLMSDNTSIDLYINKSGKVKIEAFDGTMDRKIVNNRVIFQYKPDHKYDDHDSLKFKSIE